MATDSKAQENILETRVPLARRGERFDQVALALFPDFSRARLQKWIREGQLTLDGQTVKPSQKLAGGEHLKLIATPEPDGSVIAQDLPLDRVYTDEHLLIVNKPAGLVVHPAAGHPDGTLQNALLGYDSDQAGVPRGGIVHRLDKDTSGIMVVARTLKAHASLVEQLQSRSMSRIYESVVHGATNSHGTVDAPIGRHPRDRKRMAVVDNGKPAVSHYRVLGRFGNFTHLQVSLESGRTHQIRVHMQKLGFPLLGDPTYGRKPGSARQFPDQLANLVSEFPRQALHARTLKLSHPGSGEAMVFQAPLPEDFGGLLEGLASLDPAP